LEPNTTAVNAATYEKSSARYAAKKKDAMGCAHSSGMHWKMPYVTPRTFTTWPEIAKPYVSST
jgi:hypothetical protein